jgi:hypothetical protein
MASGSPRSRTSASWRRIRLLSTPWRRYVGMTATNVTPAAGSIWSPGTLSWKL